MKKRIKLVQTLLKERGHYNSKIDGLIGPNTLAGIAKLRGIDSAWSVKRKINGAIQVFANSKKIPCKPIDGLWGPITQEAFDQLNEIVYNKKVPPIWRPEEVDEVNPNNWPKQYTKEFDDFYGEQGSSLTVIDLPYRHKFSWELSQSTQRLKCHEKVASSVLTVLENVVKEYGLTKIRELRLDVWGGCFNIRPIRGGTKPSMHSWGIAMDYDPSRNRLRWGADKAHFAKEEYQAWWEIWEEEGWVSLGRSRNFDWMHVQAAKI